MKQELVSKLKKENKYLLYLFLIGIIIFKILFYKENFLVVLRVTFSLFWVFIFPGFYLMYYWYEKIEFLERLVIGFALSAALIGISSYYIGLLGLNIKYHAVLLPSLILIISFLVIWKRE